MTPDFSKISPGAAKIIAEVVGGSLDDVDEVVATEKVREILERCNPRERRGIIKALRKRYGKLRRQVAEENRDLDERKDYLNRLIAACEEVDTWLPAKLVLERPGGSFFHHLRQDIIDGGALIYSTRKEFTHGTREYETELFDAAHVFVVEHDWAAAFANAGDYADGSEFKLPFEVCVFEFKVSGRSAAIVATESDGTVFYELMVRSKIGWLVLGIALEFSEAAAEKNSDGTVNAVGVVANFLRPQIKAICVALDAELAEADVVRAPHKLNDVRMKVGRAPLSDYHVIQLSRRCRNSPRDLPITGEVKGVRRLHFRRGHWRHYEMFKTWVRWTLVGNPDLGFVDKEYRL